MEIIGRRILWGKQKRGDRGGERLDARGVRYRVTACVSKGIIKRIYLSLREKKEWESKEEERILSNCLNSCVE